MRGDFGALRFNTAIARLMELTSHAAKSATADRALPRALAEPLVLMVAPLAPHIAEELWQRLGHAESLTYAPFPVADDELAAEPSVDDSGSDQRQDPVHGHGPRGCGRG